MVYNVLYVHQDTNLTESELCDPLLIIFQVYYSITL